MATSAAIWIKDRERWPPAMSRCMTIRAVEGPGNEIPQPKPLTSKQLDPKPEGWKLKASWLACRRTVGKTLGCNAAPRPLRATLRYVVSLLPKTHVWSHLPGCTHYMRRPFRSCIEAGVQHLPSVYFGLSQSGETSSFGSFP